MENKIVNFGTIHQCNCYLGSPTLHPLVSVTDLSNVNTMRDSLKLDVYTILLREHPCNDFSCGRQSHDYSNGTLQFLRPGQTFNLGNDETSEQKGWILVFHPLLLQGTTLGQNIQNYTFFNYNPDEALHVSTREKQRVVECLENIRKELLHAVDRHSKTLISRHIELLLDYCTRFYERQFITRCEANQKLMGKFEKLLDEYFESNHPKNTNFPSAKYYADHLQLSSRYFIDLLKFETGKSIQEYTQFKRFNRAKQQLLTTDKPVSRIAEELGYSSTPYFTRLFTKIVGYTPNTFRHSN